VGQVSGEALQNLGQPGRAAAAYEEARRIFAAAGDRSGLALALNRQGIVRWFEERSETRTHSSPPSVAVLRAAEHALALNRSWGERLRLHLARLVRRFRARLAELGLRAIGEPFPVQTIAPVAEMYAVRLHRRLSRRAVRTDLHRGGHGEGARVSVLITARHRNEDIDRLAAALSGAITRLPAH
jgi:8-amino-7-oxononanoate synthase